MMNPISAVIRVFANTLNFPGRATRSEYWWYLLFQIIAYSGAVIFDILKIESDTSYNMLFGATTITVIVLFFPTLSVNIRRLHDIGFTGWWYLLNFVPFGSIALLILACFPSEKRTNKWGPIPGQEKYLGPDIFSDEVGGPANSYDDPFASGNFYGPDKNAPVLSRAESEAARKAEIQAYYRDRVMKRQPN